MQLGPSSHHASFSHLPPSYSRLQNFSLRPKSSPAYLYIICPLCQKSSPLPLSSVFLWLVLEDLNTTSSRKPSLTAPLAEWAAPSQGSQISPCFLCLTFFFIFLGLHPKHMEVPRLGVKSEVQPLAYPTAHGNARSLTH